MDDSQFNFTPTCLSRCFSRSRHCLLDLQVSHSKADPEAEEIALEHRKMGGCYGRPGLHGASVYKHGLPMMNWSDPCTDELDVFAKAETMNHVNS